MNTWEEWRKHRQEVSSTHIPPLTTMTISEISHWLTRFILEARKKSGDPYPCNTLHHIVVGIMRHLRCCGRDIDILKDNEFREFRASLDSEMKSCGIGSQAEVISKEEEYGRKDSWETPVHKLSLTLWCSTVVSVLSYTVGRSTSSFAILHAKLNW